MTFVLGMYSFYITNYIIIRTFTNFTVHSPEIVQPQLILENHYF